MIHQKTQSIQGHKFINNMCSSLQFKSPTISLHEASLVTFSTTQVRKQVSFAEYSVQYLYWNDPLYRSKMSYSKSEIDAFRFRTASEAVKLRQLTASCPIRNPNRICRILVHHKVLAPEEVLGMEHFITEDWTQFVMSDRLDQRTLLLEKQKELRVKNEVEFELLAEISSSMSANNAKRARMRAAMAL